MSDILGPVTTTSPPDTDQHPHDAGCTTGIAFYGAGILALVVALGTLAWAVYARFDALAGGRLWGTPGSAANLRWWGAGTFLAGMLLAGIGTAFALCGKHGDRLSRLDG